MIELIHADVLDGFRHPRLRKKAGDESVDLVITSPPYYSKVDYGYKEQWGMEPTVDEYIEKLRAVMIEVYRVLKSTGSVWVNIADSYVSNSGNNYKGFRENKAIKRCNSKEFPRGTLLGIPERFFLICLEIGFIMRNKIVWAKKNPRPDSSNHKFTPSWEYIFFMTKSMKYYFDKEKIMKTPAPGTIERRKRRGESDINRGSKETDLWVINRFRKKYLYQEHPAQFPLKIPLKIINCACPPEGVVLDPFCGAGATLIAAKKLGIDIDAIGIDAKKEYLELCQRALKGML